MNIQTLPRLLTHQDVDAAVTLTWADIRFGIAQGIIGPAFAIDRAVAFVEAEKDPADDLLELCGMYPEEDISIPLDRLAKSDVFDEAAATDVWGRIVLTWVYRNRADIPDLQGLLESLYADFDYPEDWVPFIGYMPQDSAGPWSAEGSLAAYLAQHPVS